MLDSDNQNAAAHIDPGEEHDAPVDIEPQAPPYEQETEAAEEAETAEGIEEEETEAVEEESEEAAEEETEEAEEAAEPPQQGADEGGEPGMDELRARLMSLQQELRRYKIPVAIVLEGWDAAGKGTVLGKLISGLDPRGYKVYTTGPATQEERMAPLLKRFHVKMPRQGDISIFCQSWYREVSDACFEDKAARKSLDERYDRIVQMESQLVSDGTLIIKLFLHISRKEQKRRLKALEAKKSTRWRVTKGDIRQNERYDDYMRLYDAMMERTHYDGALWHVLRSDDRRKCVYEVYGIIMDAFERAIAERRAGLRPWDVPYLPHVESVKLKPVQSLAAYVCAQESPPDYKKQLDAYQKRLGKLHSELYLSRTPAVIVFEGWDASGKGGAIRRLTGGLDPRGYEVAPFAAPTAEEKEHHHLWRFWKAIPKDGHIEIFDRSWYGRAMVERIEGFCTQPQWMRCYEEINQFERELTDHGAAVVKFWLHITPEEQLRRFNERKATPEKQWKITDEDWRNREKWPQYEEAVEEMLQKTNTPHAPWVVVEADDKHFARLKVLSETIAAFERVLGK